MSLISFADSIWIADGSDTVVLGFRYPTRCAVIRLPDGGLLVWSPITLNNDLRVAVDALGQVTHLIAPNHFHHLFITEWQAAYPQAKLYGLPGLQTKRPDLRFAGVLEPEPDPAWAAVMDQVLIDNKLTREVVFFHRPSQTAIFTDLIQQFPDGWHKGIRRIIAKLDLMIGDQPNVPRKFRLGFGNRKVARTQIAPILAWPTERILLAHGEPVRTSGKAVLAQAFDWL